MCICRYVTLVLCFCHPHADAQKGLGLSGDWGDAQVQALGLSWYYNWGTEPSPSVTIPDVQFVPMIFSPKHANASIAGPVVLGFNEPDNEHQSNISVAEALAVWPQVVKLAATVGSPATAKNPVTGSWLPAFMSASPPPKVDFMTLHWYKGVNASKFQSDVENVFKTYNKTVWVTEFCPQTAAEANSNPNKYSTHEVVAFVEATLSWMKANSRMVARYAWHDPKVGTCSLWASNQLSAAGQAHFQH